MTATKVNILGTEYSIHIKTVDEEPCLKELNGFCDSFSKNIVILDLDRTEHWKEEPKETKESSMKETLRHEIIHAFFNESGLQYSALSFDGAWCKNEEMIDWFAIQSPKIFKAFKELELL